MVERQLVDRDIEIDRNPAGFVEDRDHAGKVAVEAVHVDGRGGLGRELRRQAGCLDRLLGRGDAEAGEGADGFGRNLALGGIAFVGSSQARPMLE